MTRVAGLDIGNATMELVVVERIRSRTDSSPGSRPRCDGNCALRRELKVARLGRATARVGVALREHRTS